MAASVLRAEWRPRGRRALAAAFVVTMSLPCAGRAEGPAGAATDVERPRDPAIQAAVALLGERFRSMPRIYVVDPATMHVHTTRAGFRLWYGDRVNPNVFVNGDSQLYKDARDGNRCAVKSLAAMIAHEIAHSGTKDEAGPCRVEMTVLDAFIRDPSVGSREQICLMERRAAVRLYGGIKN